MNLSVTEQKYFEGLVKWVELTKGVDGLNSLSNANNIPVLMKEYNEAYVKFWEKYLDLWGDQKKAVNDALCVSVYNGIKKHQLLKESNRQVNDLINSWG